MRTFTDALPILTRSTVHTELRIRGRRQPRYPIGRPRIRGILRGDSAGKSRLFCLSMSERKDKMAEIHRENSSRVFGYFSSERSAEAALRDLHAAGFTGSQIGVACHEEPAITVKKPEPGFWHRTQTLFGGGSNPQAVRTGSVQPLSTGQVAGPETARHSSLDAGDFHSTLTGLNLPDGRARHFSDKFSREKEGVLVTVVAGSRSSEAEAILRNNGGDMGMGIDETASGRLRKAS